MATIQGVYVALFGRPADPTGLAYFNGVTNNGANLSAIGNLASTAEYQGRFAGLNNLQIINSIYQSLFGRDADVTGLNFFANQLATGRQTINTIAINILDGATGSDLTTVNNKIAAANLYTAALDTGTEIVAYSGTAAADAGRTFLQGVTTTVPAQAAVDTAVANMVANAGTNPGSIFTLTANTDAPGAAAPAANTTGSAGNDTFNAVAGTGATLSAGDQINGGAGIDTLRVVTDTGFSVLGTNVQNVEKLSVTNVGAAMTATVVGSSSFTSFENASSLNGVTFAGAAKVDALSVRDTAASTTITYTDAAVAGANDVLALSLNGVTATAGVGATVAIDSVTGDASGVERINITSAGAASNIVITSTDTSLKTVAVSGAAALTAAVTATVTTLDASAATGNVNISGFGAVDVTATGGSGDDRFNFGSTLTATDKVDGGAGNDTVAVSTATINAAATAEVATIKALANIEILEQTAAAATLEASAITNINTFAFSGGTSVTVTGVEAGDSFRLLSDLTGNASFAPKLDTGADVLTLSATGADVTGNLVATSFETINLAVTNGTGNDDVTFAQTQVGTNGKIVLTGAGDVNLGTLVGTNATVDGSALTGKLTVVGEAGNNTIIGGSANDIISGGAGQDSIDLSKGGQDIVRLDTAVANRDTITGFSAGVGGDVLDVKTLNATLTSNDEVLAANFKTYTATGAGVTVGATEEVVSFSFDAANNSANLANATDGTELLKAIANAGSTATLTGSAVGDTGVLVAYDNGNAYVYYYDAGGDANVSAGEIALVGVLNNVAVGALTHDNFA